nr:immunoglobulin light chain junction region [Macaca mulatta]
CQHYHAYPQTF